MTSDDGLVVRTFFGLKSIIGNFRRRVKRRRGVDAVGAAMFAGVQKSEIVPMLILFLCFVVIPLTSSSTLTSASDVENHELKRLKESFKDLLTTNDIRQLFPAKNVASVDDVGSKRVKRSRGTSLQNNNIDDDDDDDDRSDDDDDKLRKRRLSGEASVMSFYRPTKNVFTAAFDQERTNDIKTVLLLCIT